jgi:hypothetical protein
MSKEESIKIIKQFFVMLLKLEFAEKSRQLVIDKATVISDYFTYCSGLCTEVYFQNDPEYKKFFTLVLQKMREASATILCEYVKENKIKRFSPENKEHIRNIQHFVESKKSFVFAYYNN